MNLPSLEKATKNLQDLTSQYQASAQKREKLSFEIQKLKAEKLAMRVTVENNKRTVSFYQNLQLDATSKIENAILDQNKAKLAAANNQEKIKQIQSKLKPKKIQLVNFDMAIPKTSGLAKQHEELLSEETQFENIVVANRTRMAELSKKLKQ